MMHEDDDSSKALKAPQPQALDTSVQDENSTNRKSRANRKSPLKPTLNIDANGKLKSPPAKTRRRDDEWAAGAALTNENDAQQHNMRGGIDTPIVSPPSPPKQDEFIPSNLDVQSHAADSMSMLTGDEEMGIMSNRRSSTTSSKTKSVEFNDAATQSSVFMYHAGTAKEAAVVGGVAVVGGGSEENQTKQPSRFHASQKRICFMVAISLLLLVVAGAIIGGIYGSELSSQRNEQSATGTTPAPTTSTVAVPPPQTPTIAPTTTAAFPPISSPVSEPTATQETTTTGAPAAATDVPAAQYSCANATVVEDARAFTETASALTMYPLSSNSNALSCPTVENDSVVKWFAVNGTDTCLEATITEDTSLDAALSVYSGTCGDSTCFRETTIGDTSRVEWYGNEGEEYHVLLRTNPASSGEYTLSVKEFNCFRNEGCASARLILETPFIDSGNTVESDEILRRSQARQCSLVDRGARGEWYAIQTHDTTSCISLSTERSNFDTIVAVLNGTCNDLTCVAENDNSPLSSETSQVEFTAEAGVLYHMFVGGAGRLVGDYAISVSMTEGACST